ncbi:uncharacterized protein LOC142226196 [Haematobia irritans]|uniref:uncharacterized protein LOC142226196 n=1 Tax=Haematobia irritans TaxID=7368 RepID=UPI003F509E74
MKPILAITIIASLAVLISASDENSAREDRSSNSASSNFGAREERSPNPGSSAPIFANREERSPMIGSAPANLGGPMFNIRHERAYGSAPSSYGSGAAAAGGASSYGAPAAPAAPVYSAPVSVPAPPCPKNYLFSCQPSLTPAPCAQMAAYGGGNTGAYSHQHPVYAPPQYMNRPFY